MALLALIALVAIPAFVIRKILKGRKDGKPWGSGLMAALVVGSFVPGLILLGIVGSESAAELEGTGFETHQELRAADELGLSTKQEYDAYLAEQEAADLAHAE